jgi:hypothetical protein
MNLMELNTNMTQAIEELRRNGDDTIALEEVRGRLRPVQQQILTDLLGMPPEAAARVAQQYQ